MIHRSDLDETAQMFSVRVKKMFSVLMICSFFDVVIININVDLSKHCLRSLLSYFGLPESYFRLNQSKICDISMRAVYRGN